jgi:Spy/CpxP family protein refolding chaperone
MRMINFAVILAFGLAAVPAALAQDTQTTTTQPPAAAQPTPQKPDPDEIICRAGQGQTGTRLPGPRVCATRAQWDQLQRDSQAETQHQQTMGLTLNGGGH